MQWIVAGRAGSEMGRSETERREYRCVRLEHEVWCVLLVCCGEPVRWEVLELEREVRLG